MSRKTTGRITRQALGPEGSLRKRIKVEDKHIQSHLLNYHSYHSAMLLIVFMFHSFFDTNTIAHANDVHSNG